MFTAEELKKRQGEEVLKVEREDKPAKKSNVQWDSPVPTDTIIAFGDYGKTEILRSATNKWTMWQKGRDCGSEYACVKVLSNIYTIGGRRGKQWYSKETDIYDISRQKWSKGPPLKVGRLELCSLPVLLNRKFTIL